jgi:hypothetical protein
MLVWLWRIGRALARLVGSFRQKAGRSEAQEGAASGTMAMLRRRYPDAPQHWLDLAVRNMAAGAGSSLAKDLSVVDTISVSRPQEARAAVFSPPADNRLKPGKRTRWRAITEEGWAISRREIDRFGQPEARKARRSWRWTVVEADAEGASTPGAPAFAHAERQGRNAPAVEFDRAGLGDASHGADAQALDGTGIEPNAGIHEGMTSLRPLPFEARAGSDRAGAMRQSHLAEFGEAPASGQSQEEVRFHAGERTPGPVAKPDRFSTQPAANERVASVAANWTDMPSGDSWPALAKPADPQSRRTDPSSSRIERLARIQARS